MVNPMPDNTEYTKIWRYVPTSMAFAGLIGIGYVGHHFAWKVPKFSHLLGNRAPFESHWCEEHGVPEEICVACNAKLMPKGKLYGWCSEHGVAECVLHHPDLAQVAGSPRVSPADLDRAARALALRPRTENSPTCKLHLRRVQLADQATVEKAGLTTDVAQRVPIVESLAANGEVTYDPTRVTRLASRTSGTVWRVKKQMGDRVHQGDSLAFIESAEIGRVKADLIQAMAGLALANQTHQRVAGLPDVVPGRRLQEAEADLAKARAAVGQSIQTLSNLGLPISSAEILSTSGPQLSRDLQFLGLPEDDIRGLDPSRVTANLVPLVAPQDGSILECNVVAGEAVDTSRTLFRIVDFSHMWLTLSVSLEDVRYVQLGQHVLFHPDGDIDSHTGSITWISPGVDPETRTVAVRVELPNADGHLRNATFGEGLIVLREAPDATVVPKEAVHWEGCCHVVFVRDRRFLEPNAYKVFHTRMVRPGVSQGDRIELIAGVLPGETVVVKGGAVLRAELLKGSLGAG
jgi:cobalt-zinc-cadmium efflux system membrane fusion protein